MRVTNIFIAQFGVTLVSSWSF